MKTIYDFNPTKQELIDYGFKSEELYKKVMSENSANLDIAYMLHDRGDERYKKYAALLPSNMLADFNRIISHP